MVELKSLSLYKQQKNQKIQANIVIIILGNKDHAYNEITVVTNKFKSTHVVPKRKIILNIYMFKIIPMFQL